MQKKEKKIMSTIKEEIKSDNLTVNLIVGLINIKAYVMVYIKWFHYKVIGY